MRNPAPVSNLRVFRARVAIIQLRIRRRFALRGEYFRLWDAPSDIGRPPRRSATKERADGRDRAPEPAPANLRGHVAIVDRPREHRTIQHGTREALRKRIFPERPL